MEEFVCKCAMVTEAEIIEAIESGAKTIEQLRAETRANTGCGRCGIMIEAILKKYV